MRFNHHSPFHWFAIAVVLAVGLFTITHARGQATGAAAAFEGRPAMAGAQGGLGAQGGMAQGGIGVQGNDAAQRQLNLRKPSGLDSAPALPGSAPAAMPVGARSDVTLVPRGDDVRRDARTPPQKVKKTVKRTLRRSRTGVGEIDAGTGAAVGTPK